MARLIRTEKEVEGRYEEVWLVVEEDALEQWPAGPARDRRPAGGADRRARARPRRSRLHRRPAAAGDAPHRGAALALRACPRPQHRPRAGARAARRARRDRAGRLDVLVDECGYRAPRSRRSAPTRSRRRARRCHAIEVEWEQLEPLLDPDEAVARGELLGEPRVRERGDLERGLAEADVVVTGEYRPRSCCTTRWRRTRRSCSGSATRSRSTSRRSTSGASATRSRASSGCPPTRCASSATTWAAASARRTTPDDYTFIAIELARRTGRPVRCALTRREENVAAGNRNATIQRLTVGARADGTLTALGGEYVNAVGWAGWSSPVEGPMQMLYACANVQDHDLRRRSSTCRR